MKKFSIQHRLLHFVIAVAMIALFITGFLRMTWMNKGTVSQVIQQELTTENIEVSKDTLGTIGKALLAPMWQWHIIFAYVILAFFTFRLIYMFAKGIKFPNPFNGSISVKERFQGLIYILFYLLVLIDIITGFYIMWGDGTYKAILEPIHKYSLYWFPIFFNLHLGGIFIAEVTTKPGIVSKMINGNSH